MIVVIVWHALREDGFDETYSRFESILAAGSLVRTGSVILSEKIYPHVYIFFSKWDLGI
jgi:hypothetical protein